uniref:DC1 domain-containing protein n=2 Tax=Hordeum vulgare subsp. vulgare TaxID=112509 RepID=A0A8I6X3Y9_HORVV
MSKQILHDAHKDHPLVLRRVAGAGFRCNGCGCNGTGFRYRCDACDFDLHELCATCPPTTLLPIHGQHPLTFEPAVVSDEGRFCHLCETAIEGMHYRCRATDFDVHPICSQLPAVAVSPLHPEHLVVLTVAHPTKCTRCSDVCLWRYRCNPCGVNLHPRCLLGPDKTPLGIPKDSLLRGFFL